MITTRPTRLSSSSNLSIRLHVPEGTHFAVIACIYGGKILKVMFEGCEYYTANPEWSPPEVTESVRHPVKPPAKTLPWDRPQRRGRGRPRKNAP